ncbi:MAG: Gfo/Idh/MocA family oxidoreductase [Ardenticatenaceae bacterium]|nr:Gfo/Idh/MocA family oxidoreductase [Ardenticatenaceae bacterium]
MTYRWGILATGNIAASMADALHTVDDADLLAVASRTQVGADAFGERWGVPRRYAGYAELAADPDVDIVYIATPHSFHAENIRLCLAAGKHVLCEKPLTLNAREAADCIDLARQNSLFLMEAVWMRFFPAIAQVRIWVDSGVIGDVRFIQADFCFHLPFDAAHRLYNPALGGGALLDLGIYPLSLTTMLLGFPDEVHGQAHIGSTGVDELNALTLVYKQGAMAQLSSSMRLNKPREAFVVGTDGYIKIHDAFFCPDQLTLHVNGRNSETHLIPYKHNGYPHEIEAVHAALDVGQLESDLMPLKESWRMMQLMDDLRAGWGIQLGKNLAR